MSDLNQREPAVTVEELEEMWDRNDQMSAKARGRMWLTAAGALAILNVFAALAVIAIGAPLIAIPMASGIATLVLLFVLAIIGDFGLVRTEQTSRASQFFSDIGEVGNFALAIGIGEMVLAVVIQVLWKVVGVDPIVIAIAAGAVLAIAGLGIPLWKSTQYRGEPWQWGA